MEHFEWNNSFSVGIEELDKQHKNIIRGINALSDSIKTGEKTKSVLFRLFRALEAYADIHFKFEEALLKDNHYPELEDHVLEHQDFRKNVKTLKDAFDSKEDEVKIELKLINFLKDWLIGHIMMTDKKYAEFLLKKI